MTMFLSKKRYRDFLYFKSKHWYTDILKNEYIDEFQNQLIAFKDFLVTLSDIHGNSTPQDDKLYLL